MRLEQRGSAPIGFVFAAPIGLLLFLSSLEMSQLVWQRSLVQHNLSQSLKIAAREPDQYRNRFREFLATLTEKPVSSNLQLVRQGEVDFLVGSITFKHAFLGYMPIQYEIKAIEVLER